jgi:[acyl-carrier-protein] S-malonyltransferase
VAFAGHSLGQFSALVAAGCLSVGAGVRLVSARGAITERFARRTPGRMAALLGVSVEQATEACEAAPGDCWVANDNAPGQVVIAGSPGGMDAACDHARELGARRIVPLRISGAFHTPLLARASKMFGRTLATSSFTYPSAPVVSNEDARAYDDAQGWRDRLRRHLVTPVRWRESLNTMVKMGAQNLVELGPGTTLAGLARRSVPGVRVVSVSSPDDLPRLAQLSTR